MSSSFVRARPGQAFKLTVIPGAVILLGVDMAVWLPGGELCRWLSSFLPVILAIAVSVEALLTGAGLCGRIVWPRGSSPVVSIR